jgi:hypothetical protein
MEVKRMTTIMNYSVVVIISFCLFLWLWWAAMSCEQIDRKKLEGLSNISTKVIPGWLVKTRARGRI